MEKDEILQKAQKEKFIVGEMERAKINNCNWIAIISAGVLAISFMIIFGILNQKAAMFAIGAICFVWASVFYFCQFFIAKRPWQVLIGAILEAIGALIMILNFVLVLVGII